MKIFELRSLEESTRHWRRTLPERQACHEWLGAACQPYREARRPFVLPGYSHPAHRMVDFTIDWNFSSGDQPNWRERLVCPVTNLNTRLRASRELIDTHLGLYPDSPIYLTEQVTPLLHHLSQSFPGVIGSEYLGPGCQRGACDERGIRHEDLTQLSFPDATFDAVLSFECLEHIPDFPRALAECHRVLRPGGHFLFSVPFNAAKIPNTIRARLRADGEIEHLMEPEYHGDPVRAGGCLCFTHFGWELLDNLRQAGFSDACALAFWTHEFGFPGQDLLFFRAKR